jgi:hypothetical protein
MADSATVIEQTLETAVLSLNTASDNHVALGEALGRDASGNIGVNATAGAFNLQANLVTVSFVDSAALAQASASSVQQVAVTSGLHSSALNGVTVGGAVLQGASGNIGVNIAAGTGNVQLNSVTLAHGRPQP